MESLVVRKDMFPIWRPTQVIESIDGEPLATTVASLFYEFPYNRLPIKNHVLALFMRPEVVMLVLIFYLVSKKPLAWFKNMIQLDPKTSKTFSFFIALHNLGLAIFSGICCWNAWCIVLQHLSEFGFFSIYCDKDKRFWADTGFGSWCTIFYLSKYYEFVDTWILVLKGKPASFLQVYHHTGIAFIMWAAVASQSSWLLFAVLLNSLIHTLMYIYFFIKTISPTTEIRAAKYLTMAQITQFLIGIACTVGVFVLGDDCASESSRFALACLHLYGFGLIALFVNFASKKYKKE